MCVIVQYLCQKCKQETGQRDYVSHTDGQSFTIPRAEPKMDVISFCPDIRSFRAIIHDPLVQSPAFPCGNNECPISEGTYKATYDATKCQEQNADILALLRDTDYNVAVQGYSFTDVKEKLKCEGIKMRNIRKLPGAKFQKWNLYTEDMLKKMSAKGDSYDDIKTALKAITGLNYTTYQIIAKAASFKLQQSLFPLDPSRPWKTTVIPSD